MEEREIGEKLEYREYCDYKEKIKRGTQDQTGKGGTRKYIENPY